MSAPRFAPFVLASLVLALGTPGAARASDTVYGVLVGGRPVDREGGSGRVRAGHLYVNVINVTRSLAGVITFHEHDKSMLVTVGGHSVLFTVGSKDATVDDAGVQLTAAPFVSNGDIFVPLDTLAKVAGATFTTNAKSKLVMLAPSDAGSLVVPTSTTPVQIPASSSAPVPAPAAT